MPNSYKKSWTVSIIGKDLKTSDSPHKASKIKNCNVIIEKMPKAIDTIALKMPKENSPFKKALDFNKNLTSLRTSSMTN